MIKLITFILFFLWLGIAQAQFFPQRGDLEQKKKLLNQQIEQTTTLLNKTKQNKQNTIYQLNTLQRQMRSREDLINTIAKEVKMVDGTIAQKGKLVESYTKELDMLRIEYAQLLRTIYKYRQIQPTATIVFSPTHFQQQYQQEFYLMQLEQKRSQQLRVISYTQKALKLELDTLTAQKEGKTSLLESAMIHKKQLSKEVANKDKLVKQLSQKEKNLRTQITKAEQSKTQLAIRIEAVIRDEIAIAKANARSYPVGGNNPQAGTMPKIDNKTLTTNFAKSKGLLSKPVVGTIVGTYGRSVHPEMPMIFIQNNGIDIQAKAGATVQSIYDGVVVSVFTIPGMGNAIMIQHGEYYTTYSNLASVSTKRGMIVKTKQAIGTVGKEATSSRYILHFELWKGKNKENPSAWVR